MTLERATPGDAEWTELSAPHLARYLFAAEYARGRQTLDAGAGSGYGAILLAQAGAANVLAIDIDASVVEQAQQSYQIPGLTFGVDDCETLTQSPGPFDLICSFENIEHLRHPQAFLAAAAHRLRPDGTLLISTPDSAASPPCVNGRPRNPYHYQEWDQAGFQELLSPFFADVELRVQVVTSAQQARMEAVAALRQGLLWSNPLTVLLWRKWPPGAKKTARGWKKLAGLAAPSPADYPIVAACVASAWGASRFHVAICRHPHL